jgi:hypothetical protein
MSKFKSIKERYQEVVNKIKEDAGDKPTYDNSWRFNPTLPSNKPKVNYVLRVLPNVHQNEGLDEPWFESFVHIYTRSSGKKVYTPCPTSNGKDKKCPICEKARGFWTKVNAGEASKSEEDLARAYNRKQRYHINVLVVDDPRKGTEEDQTGKVLVWEIGPQIYEKFKDAFFDQKLPFFDPFEGYNFNLVIKKKGEYNNYDASHFSTAASAIGTEEELEAIHSQIHNLPEKVASRMRTYDDLKKLLDTPTEEAMGGESDPTLTPEGSPEIDSGVVAAPAPKAVTAPKVAPKALETAAPAAPRVSAAKAQVEPTAESETVPEEKDGDIDLEGLTDEDLFK